MKRGVVVGKFSPLHLGHEWMINQAASQCDELLIVSYSNPEFKGYEAPIRHKWLKARFPNIRSIVLSPKSIVMPDNNEPDDVQQRFFAWILKSIAYYPATTLFCSESWGPACAKVLTEELGHQVDAVVLDVDRTIVPVSGTKLRESFDEYKQFLSPEVRGSFVKRIVLLGGESTGKSVLAQALATKYNTNWVAEYGRELYIQKEGKLTRADLLDIGHEQIRREEEALLTANKFLFCDTSPLTTHLYEDWMFQEANAELRELAKRPYDGIILCANDFPFVQDGSRVDEEFRTKQQERYRKALTTFKWPMIEVFGEIDHRIENVSNWLKDFK